MKATYLLTAIVLILGVGLFAEYREVSELRSEMRIHAHQLGDLDAKTAACESELKILPQAISR